MKYVIWFLVITLVVLHQDYWNWDKSELVFDFMPFTMAYNIAISLATVVVWILATTFCWPDHLDGIEREAPPKPTPSGGSTR